EIPEFPVAGKTGTGQKTHIVGDERNKGYSEDMWVATFFGVAPLDNPKLAVMVLVDEPQGRSHGGGTFAAPAFKEIMYNSLRLMGVPSPLERDRQVAWLEPDLLKERRRATEKKSETSRSLSPPVDPSSAGDVPVPDFDGLTMDQVRRLAMRSGLGVRLRGTGTATSQSIAAHARVPSWSTVSVDFEPRNAEATRGLRPSAPAGVPSLPNIHGPTGPSRTQGKVL
ncbi:MAG: penicillin-binding transpeptidase domain-containing protein, partial [Myxococcota bacterium]|nr:penicillin-binding transpeptidase domain-containing protein [Myxococcota bacterium]